MEHPALALDHAFQIAAPASIVWEVVTDLASYPAWNPFVIACRSELRVGSPITMRVRLLPGPALSQREKIFEHVPGERLCYGLEGAFFGSVSSRRCHVVSNAGSSITRYESRFVLGGRLAPVVRALLGRRLAHGFEAMTQALRLRAEALAREGGWGR